MAKSKTPVVAPKHYSKLAQWMIDAFGIQRLKMMKLEYQAGLPHDMPPHIRQQRIEAINEIFPSLK
ncbi:hypothetical protein [Spirosoma aerolatum]|uniref:hypothetical protein n=1 Tax=Spirosoma aerolatum TaxID=1211326 RepID=UPI0012D2B963|nr:hypothetical protein [Spirosoma aerolatum]